jgi:hypothetical protein
VAGRSGSRCARTRSRSRASSPRRPRRPDQLLALGAIAALADVADADGPFDIVLESVGGESLKNLDTLVRLVSRGALHPQLGVVAGWQRTAAVLADLRQRRVTGNAVLTTTSEIAA